MNTSLTKRQSTEGSCRDEANNFVAHLTWAPNGHTSPEHDEPILRRSVAHGGPKKRDPIVHHSFRVLYSQSNTQLRTVGPICWSGEHCASHQYRRPDPSTIRVAHSAAATVLSAPSLSRRGSGSSTGSQRKLEVPAELFARRLRVGVPDRRCSKGRWTRPEYLGCAHSHTGLCGQQRDGRYSEQQLLPIQTRQGAAFYMLLNLS